MTPADSVLIVDDEPAVRDLMSRWVASLGLRPQTAANADEALASLRTQHYDLAVIDVMMPGHDGLWLADEAAARSSAHRRDHRDRLHRAARAPTRQQPPIADLLIKPFQRDRFALAVDRGRQWRKQALEEVHWHAVLVDRVARSRGADPRMRIDARVAAGASESRGADGDLSLERMPDVAAHARARRALRARRSRASWTSIARSAPISRSRRAFTTSASWRCPRR